MEEYIVYYLMTKDFIEKTAKNIEKYNIETLQNEIFVNNEWIEFTGLNDFVNLKKLTNNCISVYFSVKNSPLDSFILTYTLDDYFVLGVSFYDYTENKLVDFEKDFFSEISYILREITVEGIPPTKKDDFQI